jgi:hypothetical protein
LPLQFLVPLELHGSAVAALIADCCFFRTSRLSVPRIIAKSFRRRTLEWDDALITF